MPPATTLDVDETAVAEIRACAAASCVTSNVRDPVAVPVAVAVTELEVDVAVEPVHVDVAAREPARVPTDAMAVESLPSASAALCCEACWFFRRVCWLPWTDTS